MLLFFHAFTPCQGSNPRTAWLARYAKFKSLGIEDGLSQNSVYAIAQDRQGFLWLGTQAGLNRFDGYGFRVFQHSAKDPTTISGNTVSKLFIDRDGRLWAGTQGDGLNLFDAQSQGFTRYRQKVDTPGSLSSDLIHVIFQDHLGDMWVGTENGLNRQRAGADSWQTLATGPGGLPHYSVYTVTEDDQGQLWVGTARGLSRLDPQRENFRHWHRDVSVEQGLIGNNVSSLQAVGPLLYVGTNAGLSIFDQTTETFTNHVSSGDGRPLMIDEIISDKSGLIWIATGDGLLAYNPRDGEFERFMHRKNDPWSISGNVITALCEDASGILWVGTESKGFSMLNPYSSKITHIPPRSGPEGLPEGAVIGFYEDRKGRFWITLDGGGLVQFDVKEGRFFNNLTYNPQAPDRGPSDNNLWSISEDVNGVLWIPSRNGLNRFDPDSGQWRHYKHDPADPASLTMNKMFCAYIDTQDTLWVATFSSGLDVMEDEAGNGKFRHYAFDPNNPNGLSSGLTLYVGGDHHGQVWVGTYGSGLSLFQRESDDFKNFQHDPNDSRSLAEDTVGHIFHDSADRLWISTSDGISLYHWDSQDFTSYSTKDGLADGNTYAITEDNQGFIWVSTNSGISRFDTEKLTFLNLDTSHNLQGTEFNQMAALNRDGILYFGGINGFNIFDPQDLERKAHAPSVVFTDFKKFNEPVKLNPTIENLDYLELNYDDQVVSFEFAALDFLAPKRNRYAYRMSGFSNDEIQLGNKHDITFTNLDPGLYKLQIRAANANGVWSEQARVLKIRVLAPFWRSGLAYVIYVVGILILLGGAWHYQQQRLQKAELINVQLRNLDRLKDEFLANTSQELRTPLAGMIGMAESLLGGAASAPQMGDNLGMIVSNGKRLQNMIGDLLDFSKMKHQSLVLKVKMVDVYAVSKVVVTLFEPLLEKKPVTIVNAVPNNLPLVMADENRLQQILYNLVDNAVKFTNEGEIWVAAALKGKFIEVTVSDTGIGIPEERHQDIFVSFQQLGRSENRGSAGSGLGLAVTRQLVELHQGWMSLVSQEGSGSQFSFTLPATENTANLAPKIPLMELLPSQDVEMVQDGNYDESKFQVLVVDDERVNRAILNNHLKLKGYHVVLARDGHEALRMLFGSRRFDLVLLDILMPRMTGFEVCKKLRESFSLQELPVIFLTAKDQSSEMNTGFQLGANDYLLKPFSKDELLARVRMHLSLLDIHRNLESMVVERTIELERQYNELETLDVIVQSINRELRMEDLLEVILKEGLGLFPQADSGSFLIMDGSHEFYRVAASSGYPEELARRVRMTPEQVNTRYRDHAEELEEGINIICNPNEETRPQEVRDLTPPKSLLTMEVMISGISEGFLVLDHSTSSQGFAIADVKRLQRLREHIVSAISRVRLLDNLQQSQRDLVEAAHMFGMADNASLVLHNMGNKLNSVNTSVQVMRERMERAQWTSVVGRIRASLDQADGPEWMKKNAENARLLNMFGRVFTHADTWTSGMTAELRRLECQVNDVIQALRGQWDYTTIQGAAEATSLVRLVQACVRQNQKIIRLGILVEEHYDNLPLIPIQKVKLMRVFFCLLENAIEAIVKRAPASGGLIILSAQARGQFAEVTIEDNGLGVSPADLDQLFVQGFTTKASTPNGYGLHNCANGIREMGGCLTLQSDGVGKGAIATIKLPLQLEA